jgi:hypothetical protein
MQVTLPQGVSVTAAAKRSTRVATVVAWVGGVGGVAVAIGVAGMSALGVSVSHVEGQLVATGQPLTAFTFKPTKCASGYREGYHGVVLGSEQAPDQGIKLVRDPVKGMLVTVQVPGTCNPTGQCKAVVFDAEECAKYDVVVSTTNTTVNKVRMVEGHLALDCKFKETGGTVQASLKFSRCH